MAQSRAKAGKLLKRRFLSGGAPIFIDGLWSRGDVAEKAASRRVRKTHK
jgi:hypothetical protein